MAPSSPKDPKSSFVHLHFVAVVLPRSPVLEKSHMHTFQVMGFVSEEGYRI